MSEEFGHFYSSGPGFHIDIWGDGPFTIQVGKRKYRFEDSDRFGPQIVNRNGDIGKLPGERSHFWRAHGSWVRQGRRLDGDVCVWEEDEAARQAVVDKIMRAK